MAIIHPNGIPDPNNPGNDTNGFPLGADPNVSVDTGATVTEGFGSPGSGTPSFSNFSPNNPAPPPGPQPSPTDWQSLQTQTFGTMPSVAAATPPPFSYDPFNAPAPFAAPSWQDVLKNDPGIDFRINEGTRAMEQGAAARGVLNTGGTLQDLVDYGQKAASQGYGDAYSRALGTYDENYRNALNSYITNFGSALTKYNTNYGTQYQTPFNQLMAQYGQGVNNQAQLFGQQFQTATA